MKLPAGWRPRIKVMGAFLQCIDVWESPSGVMTICYQNRSAKTAGEREQMHACTLADWLEWDRRGRAADRRVG